MKKLFLFLSILSLIPLTLFFYSLHFLHQQLNFHATEDTTTSPLAQTVQTQYLIKSDGRRLAYWYFPVKNPKAVVILIHGYSNPGGRDFQATWLSRGVTAQGYVIEKNPVQCYSKEVC